MSKMSKKDQPGKKASGGQNNPMQKKEDLEGGNDGHIDEDFPGYPHHPGSEKIINPKSRQDRAVADTDKHNGSGGAFEATEEGGDEGDDDR